MISGIVLAAGAGRRLGRPKAELVVGGSRLVDRAIATLRAGGCDEVVAVVRSAELTADARLVVNPEPDSGMGSSLRLGLSAVAAESRACVVLLVDLPGVRADEVAAVIGAYRSGAGLVAVRRGGRRSHPVLVDRSLFSELAGSAEGDQGGRAFFGARLAETAFIDYPDPITDIDTAADLAEVAAGLGSGTDFTESNRVQLSPTESDAEVSAAGLVVPEPPAPPPPSERSRPAG